MTRHLPSLRALRAFEAAGRLMSFARAAEELHVTPAAISQQIKGLEDDLGETLFHRESTLRPTPAAAAALPRLSEAFDQLERAADILRSNRPRPLVVTAPPAFAGRWLIPRLERFHAAHPEIDLRLSASARLVDLEAEDVDLAIRYGPGHYPGLFVERLNSERVVTVAVPRLARQIASAADLLNVTLLHSEGLTGDLSFPDWPTLLAAQGIDPARAQIRTYGGEVNLVIEAALAGLGVALVWQTLVTDELAGGRLSTVFQGRDIDYAYHFVCPSRRLRQPSVTAFHAWIKVEMGHPPGASPVPAP